LRCAVRQACGRPPSAAGRTDDRWISSPTRHDTVWLGGLAVDVDLAALAGLLRLRASSEQTRDVEPDI
jgi:hypothetical protein